MKERIMKATELQQNSNDVIKLLKADHQVVKELFAEYEELQEKKASKNKKAELVQQICEELTLHALAEEKVVYPVVRKAIKDDDLMDEADVEHAGAKKLIKELEKMSPEDSHYDAKVTVLREYIEHHVKEEEKQMFVQLKDSELDREELAQAVTEFKEKHKKSAPKKATQ